MKKFKAILTAGQTVLFDEKMSEITGGDKLTSVIQQDSYFQNIDMESSISKQALRVRYEIRNGRAEYGLTLNVLSEGGSEWAVHSEIHSGTDENIYKILSATGFKRLATLQKKRTCYSAPFKMTKDEIYGFGTIIKLYYNSDAEKENIISFFNSIGVTAFEERPNLQIFLDYLKRKTALNKDAGVSEVKNAISELLEKQKTVIIGIAGGSGSGKTFISGELCQFIPDSVVFTLDDYYKDRDWIIKNLNSNFDDPEAINIDLAAEHIGLLKSSVTVNRPKRSLELGRVVGSVEVKPAKLIIVEGIYALNEKLAGLYDYSVFIDARLHGKLIRRLIRDIGKTGQDFEGILLQYVSTVQPMYEKHIEPTKNAASLIINNEFAPSCETYNNINRFEYKMRRPFAVPIETLKKVGAAVVSENHQIDKYYVSPGVNFVESDELLRIREENGRLLLTYKGPKKGNFQRPRIDFPISKKFSEVLLYLGYSNPITTEKVRYKFTSADFPKLDIVIDEVKNLGNYIEVRVNSSDGEKTAGEFLKLLGISGEISKNKSYFGEIIKKTFNI